MRERHHHAVVDNMSGSVIDMYPLDEIGLDGAREYVSRHGGTSIINIPIGARYEDSLNGFQVHGTESTGGINTDNLSHIRRKTL